MDQFDRGSRQHTNEELIRRKLVTRRGYGLSGGLSGVIGLVLVILLLVFMGDCADERAAADPSPSAEATIAAERQAAP